MSRVRIITIDGDFFIFPREDVRRVAISTEARIKLLVNLAREDEPYTIEMRYWESQDGKTKFSRIHEYAEQIRNDLDPYNPDTNVTWTQHRDCTWTREENK